MSLIKLYVSEFLKENINYDDHKNIRKYVMLINKGLENKGIDLNNLDLDPRHIARLRDRKEYVSSEEVDVFGLGFNPFSVKNKLQQKKIELLLNYYKSTVNKQKDKPEIKSYIKILEVAKAIASISNNQKIPIIGSGIFRVVFSIPNVNNVVLKIALSKSGRSDNKHESDFSTSGKITDLRNRRNFLKIYDFDKNGVWIVAEKVTMLSDLIKNESEYEQIIEKIINNNFKNTFSFFEKSGFLKIYELFKVSKMSMLVIYLSHVFKDSNRSSSSIKEKNNFSHFKNILYDFINIVLVHVKDNIAPDFIESIKKYISETDESVINSIFNELSSLYRQFMNSEATDIHQENLGLKKDNSGNWELIFTDIDSKTYSS
jgi:hypothetical protein